MLKFKYEKYNISWHLWQSKRMAQCNFHQFDHRDVLVVSWTLFFKRNYQNYNALLVLKVPYAEMDIYRLIKAHFSCAIEMGQNQFTCGEFLCVQ